MTIYSIAHASLSDSFRVTEIPDGALVTTHCIYPSNGFVRVVVRGGNDCFVVSDEGGALLEIEAAGAEIDKPDRLLRHLVLERGLEMADGMIRSPRVGPDAVAVAIALVANTSRDVADWLFSHTKIKRERDFKDLLRQFLEAKFADKVRHETLVGQSNKAHKFDHLLHLPDGKRIIVDPVLHDPSSINARVVANMDVRLAGYDNLEQRIVYDDEEDWTAEDINLLQVGAAIVMPFSRASDALGRFSRVSQ